MTKRKTPRRTRKRGRRKPGEETDAETKEPVISDARIEAVYSFVERMLTPRLLAATARRLGASDVRPRDFHCACAPSYEDGLPLCENAKPGCRFADRARLVAPEANARYDVAWRAALDNYRGRKEPRVIPGAQR